MGYIHKSFSLNLAVHLFNHDLHCNFLLKSHALKIKIIYFLQVVSRYIWVWGISWNQVLMIILGRFFQLCRYSQSFSLVCANRCLDSRCFIQCLDSTCFIWCLDSKCSIWCLESRCFIQCLDSRCFIWCLDSRFFIWCLESSCQISFGA